MRQIRRYNAEVHAQGSITLTYNQGQWRLCCTTLALASIVGSY